MFVGYRGWLIRTINGEPTLVSPSHTKMPWAPGENTAQCPACILSMDENCSCGFYALREPESELVTYEPDIVGQVFLWGRVVEGDRGFRAKIAMVSILLIPSVAPLSEELLTRLSGRYNAPLIKAEGQIVKAITKVRTGRMIKQGRLRYVAGIKQYEKDWGWYGKAPLRSGDRL